MKTYQFMAEIADRRSKTYRELDKKLDKLVLEFGVNSKEVNDFFNEEIILNN